jgi:DNA-binding protein YbaB
MDDAGAAEVAARLREQAARLTAVAGAAAQASHKVSSDPGKPGEVSVTATGAGRITRVYVGPHAMRSGAAALAPALARLMNEAIDGARRGAAQAVDEAAGPELRARAAADGESGRLAHELAAEEFSAPSPNRNVTVTATGAGQITKVTFGATALRGYDNLTLGEQIAAAANAALAAAAEREQRRLGSAVEAERAATGELDARVAAFGRRMDDLLGQLDATGQRISGLE